MKKNLGHPFEPPENVRTPATNIIRELPGLTRVSRALGYSSTKVEIWNLLFDKDAIEAFVIHTNHNLETERNSLGATANKYNYRATDALKSMLTLDYSYYQVF